MSPGTHLIRSICIVFAACVGIGVGNLAALGHTTSPFRYDFGPAAEREPGDSSRNEIVHALVNHGDNIVSLVDYAMSRQGDDQLGLYAMPDAAFGHGIYVDYLGSEVSFRHLAEPVVPEPSTILGGVAAAGLLLAFLVRRRVQRRASAQAN